MSVDTVLARQAGVITRAQGLAAGLSPSTVEHLVRTRRWRPLHPRVYLAAGHRLEDEARVRAAACWAGDGAVLSGLAAAWWHGLLPAAPPVVAVTVARKRRPRRRRGVAVRRRDLAPPDVVVHRGLATTAYPLTVLEAAVELGPAGGPLLDRALQRSVGFPAVYAAYCRNLGTAGSAAAARLLIVAADRSAAVAERLLVRLLREAGLDGWRCGVPEGGHVVDVGFREARVAVEVDGWAWHTDTARAQADEQRQNALVRAGWTVLRYTWHDLVQRPHAVVGEIRHAVVHGGRLRTA